MIQNHQSALVDQLTAGSQNLAPADMRVARRLAVQYVYGADLQQQSGFSEWGFRAFQEQMQVPQGLLSFLGAICELVMGNLSNIDELIQKNCHNWRLPRIGKVDLAILRVCTGELLFRTDLPVEIVLSDAAEIGRELGSEGSSAFVNGVLDAVARSVRAEKS